MAQDFNKQTIYSISPNMAIIQVLVGRLFTGEDLGRGGGGGGGGGGISIVMPFNNESRSGKSGIYYSI